MLDALVEFCSVGEPSCPICGQWDISSVTGRSVSELRNQRGRLGELAKVRHPKKYFVIEKYIGVIFSNDF